MTATRDPDRLLRAWLDLMPDEAPDRAIAAVLQATQAAPQARALPWTGRWRSPMNRLPRAVTAMATVLILVALLAAAALVVGSLIRPTTPPPSVLLVAREDGLFLGDPTTSPLGSIVGNRPVLEVDRSPSGRYAATRWLDSDPGGAAVIADIVPLDGSAAPAHGPSGALLALASTRVFGSTDDGSRGAAALAWAPVVRDGRELLAVLSAFNGLVVIDAAGTVIADVPRTADASAGAGVAWSSGPDGSLAVTWTTGRDIWRTTIPRSGEVSSRMIVRLSDVDGEVSGAGPFGNYIRQLATTADGRQIAATIATCNACATNLWLVQESGAAALLTDRVAADGWLSFGPNDQAVLATVFGSPGEPGQQAVLLPLAGGPESSIGAHEITGGAGRVLARWLPDGRFLVGWANGFDPPRVEDDFRQLQFWVLEPGGRRELVATDALDVDLPR